MKPRDERVSINREFSSIEELVSEYVSDISRSGVFIRSEAPLPVGMRVNLRFTVIVDDIETIEGLGEVVRLSQDPLGMGVVFIKLSEESEELVGRLFPRDEEGELSEQVRTAFAVPLPGPPLPPAATAPYDDSLDLPINESGSFDKQDTGADSLDLPINESGSFDKQDTQDTGDDSLDLPISESGAFDDRESK